MYMYMSCIVCAMFLFLVSAERFSNELILHYNGFACEHKYFAAPKTSYKKQDQRMDGIFTRRSSNLGCVI